MHTDLSSLLRAVVRAESLDHLGAALTAEIASSRSVVLARVWFIDEGGLQLASSAGTPSGGGSYTRLDGEFREMAVATAKIQEIASSGQPLVVRVRGDEEWLTNCAWAARQGVRTFLAFPLVARGQVFGLIAWFDREMPDAELITGVTLVADIAGHRAAEVRPRPVVPPVAEVLTRAALRRIEKENIELALRRTQGKVFGPDGAAALLEMRPTTLASRVKALGIR